MFVAHPERTTPATDKVIDTTADFEMQRREVEKEAGAASRGRLPRTPAAEHERRHGATHSGVLPGTRDARRWARLVGSEHNNER